MYIPDRINTRLVALLEKGKIASDFDAHVGDLETIEALLEHGAMLDNKDEYSRTPLHLEAENLALKKMEVLLQHGADVHAKDINGWTPLHFVVYEGENKFFLDQDYYRPEEDDEALMLRMDKSIREVVLLLLRYGACINAADNDGYTPLHLATQDHSYPTIVKILIENKADVNRRNIYGDTPLQNASGDVAKILRENGAKRGRF